MSSYKLHGLRTWAWFYNRTYDQIYKCLILFKMFKKSQRNNLLTRIEVVWYCTCKLYIKFSHERSLQESEKIYHFVLGFFFVIKRSPGVSQNTGRIFQTKLKHLIRVRVAQSKVVTCKDKLNGSQRFTMTRIFQNVLLWQVLVTTGLVLIHINCFE